MFFNRRKRSNQILFTLLVLIFTFSIVLVLPQTLKTTTTTNKIIMLENEINRKNNREITEWTKTFGGINHDEGFWVEHTSDGGYIITGEKNLDVWLIKTDENGNQLWNKTFKGGIGSHVLQTSDEGYIITGSKYSYDTDSYNVWLIKQILLLI